MKIAADDQTVLTIGSVIRVVGAWIDAGHILPTCPVWEIDDVPLTKEDVKTTPRKTVASFLADLKKLDNQAEELELITADGFHDPVVRLEITNRTLSGVSGQPTRNVLLLTYDSESTRFVEPV